MPPAVIPILPSPNADETSSFYRIIGFEEAARYPNEYLIMKHPAGIELHFFHNSKMSVDSNDHGCYVRFDTADEVSSLFAAWSAAIEAPGILHPPTPTSYGLVEFAMLDVHKNLLRIGGAA